MKYWELMAAAHKRAGEYQGTEESYHERYLRAFYELRALDKAAIAHNRVPKDTNAYKVRQVFPDGSSKEYNSYRIAETWTGRSRQTIANYVKSKAVDPKLNCTWERVVS